MTLRSLLFKCLMTIYILGANKEEEEDDDENYVSLLFRWLGWKVDNIIRIDTIFFFFFFFSLLTFLSEAFYTTSRCEKVWAFLGLEVRIFWMWEKKEDDVRNAEGDWAQGRWGKGMEIWRKFEDHY